VFDCILLYVYIFFAVRFTASGGIYRLRRHFRSLRYIHMDADNVVIWRLKWHRLKAHETCFLMMLCLKIFDIYKCLISSLEFEAVGFKRGKLGSTTPARHSATAATPIRAKRIS
jgi:hypothetical protein